MWWLVCSGFGPMKDIDSPARADGTTDCCTSDGGFDDGQGSFKDAFFLDNP